MTLSEGLSQSTSQDEQEIPALALSLSNPETITRSMTEEEEEESDNDDPQRYESKASCSLPTTTSRGVSFEKDIEAGKESINEASSVEFSPGQAVDESKCLVEKIRDADHNEKRGNDFDNGSTHHEDETTNLNRGPAGKWQRIHTEPRRRSTYAQVFHNTMDYFDDFMKGDNDDDDSSNCEQALPEDIYSLIYTARSCTQPFFFAYFTFLLQGSLLGLILFDLVDLDSLENQIKLPPGVPISVNVAQFIGVFLITFIVCVYGDMTSGISRLFDGYDSSILENHPDAFRLKWFMSGFLQFLVGLLMTLNLFVLMMQSTDVIGLCLNFAALHFVQEIDDIAFLLGRLGFLTEAVQRECIHVSSLVIPKGRTNGHRNTRRFFALFLFIGMMIPYIILIDRQWKGKYVCQHLYIQFGDAYLPQLAFFSGKFTLSSRLGHRQTSKIGFRPYYLDETQSIKLAYCNDLSAWTFTSANHTDPCLAYFVRSPSSQTFDVASLTTEQWYTWNLKTKNLVFADWFYIECIDCGGVENKCAAGGQCIDNECVCDFGRMGYECEHKEPQCDTLAIDARTKPLPMEEGVTFPDTYYLYKYNLGVDEDGNNRDSPAVVIHNRPVYVSDRLDENNVTEFMVFGGRRWLIYAKDDGPDYALSQAKDDAYAEYLGEVSEMVGADTANLIAEPESKSDIDILYEFWWSGATKLVPEHNELFADLEANMALNRDFLSHYRPYFFSEPVDYGTPSDVLEPAGLNWFRSTKNLGGLGDWKVDEAQPIDTRLLCAKCDHLQFQCFNSKSCVELTSTCNCGRFFVGSRCEQPVRCTEMPCLNNGTCSEWHGYCECDSSRFYGNLCQYDSTVQIEAFQPP